MSRLVAFILAAALAACVPFRETLPAGDGPSLRDAIVVRPVNPPPPVDPCPPRPRPGRDPGFPCEVCR